MSDIITRSFRDVRWYVYPEFADGLEPILEEIAGTESFEGSVRFRLVTEYPEGLSLFVLKAGHPVLPGELWIKIYEPRSLRDYISVNMGKSLLEREWKMSIEHKKRNLPIPTYLAMGKKFRNRRQATQYLILESLGLYQSFDQYYRYTFRPAFPEAGVEKKRALIKVLASIARRMHDAGVFRPGLKPSQIVIASRESGLAPVLTGPEQAVINPPPRQGTPMTRRIEALALLDSNFAGLFNLSYRLRFFKDYFRPDNLDSNTFQGLVRAIMTSSEELALKAWDSVERDVIRRRGSYYWFKTGSYRIFVSGLVYQNSLVELVDSLPEIMEKRETVNIKMIGEAKPVQGRVFVCPAGREGRDGRKSGALHGFTMAAFLKERNLLHLDALAAIESRSLFGADRGKGYIILQQPSPGCLNIAESLARKVADEFSGIPWDRTDLINLAHFLRRMHEMSLVYSPCSGTDLWVCLREAVGREFLFSNPHNLILRRPLSRQEAARHLAEFFAVLPVSEADSTMILEEYLRFSRRFSGQRKAFMADYAKYSHRAGIHPGGRP